MLEIYKIKFVYVNGNTEIQYIASYSEGEAIATGLRVMNSVNKKWLELHPDETDYLTAYVESLGKQH